MGDDLKPCPWCGAAAEVFHGGVRRYARCSNAEASGGPCSIGYRTDDDWNTRPAEDALRARADAAEAELSALAATVGAAVVASALAPGESLSAPPRHIIVSQVNRLRARAEAAEQRAEALAAELAQARADRDLLAGLWLGTVPHDVLPALLPETLADRGRLTAALDAVDLQPSVEARIAAGRAVIARIVAEMGGGAA